MRQPGALLHRLTLPHARTLPPPPLALRRPLLRRRRRRLAPPPPLIQRPVAFPPLVPSVLLLGPGALQFNLLSTNKIISYRKQQQIPDSKAQ